MQLDTRDVTPQSPAVGGAVYRSTVTPQRKKDLSDVQLDPSGAFTGDLADLVTILLKKNPGVFVGDRHGTFAIAENLERSMKEFKSAGVSILYFEMVQSKDQALLDETKKSGNYDALERYLKPGWEVKPGMARKYADIVKAAHQAGINVIGIDTFHTGETRIETSNPHWVGVINGTSKDQRYIVFGGLGHAANYLANKGVDYRLGIPSVTLDNITATEDYITRGDSKASDFRLGLMQSPNQPPSHIPLPLVLPPLR